MNEPAGRSTNTSGSRLFPAWGRADTIGLAISLLAVLVSAWITVNIFESMAHLEDEMAYVWQADVIARGKLSLPSPPDANSFLVPFVVDYEGQRFGKYPLGWPALLGIGVRLGLRSLINPLLAGLAVWLTYRLGRRTFGVTVGLLGALLMLSSPFFLMNSGSLLSHPFSLVLSLGLTLAWFDAFTGQAVVGLSPEKEGRVSWEGPRAWLPTLVAALCLGGLALTRPLTAVAVGLPFGLHGLVILARGTWAERRRVLFLGIAAVLIGALNFLWQYAVTGDPFLNPYTLWWAYDQIGFGPGIGLAENGHNLNMAWINTRFSLQAGWMDLFGWGSDSWIFLPFGGWALLKLIHRSKVFGLRGFLVASQYPILVLVYMLYWIGSWLFGPRYYYEGLPGLVLLSAAGIALLAGWPDAPWKEWQVYSGWKKARPLLVTGLLAGLLSVSWLFYTPQRLALMHGLYGVERSHIQPFLASQAQELAPALVIVHPKKDWIEYGTLLELQNPFLDTPFVFVISRGAKQDARVAARFPDRTPYHYYPKDDAYTLIRRKEP
jgi:hypothetical protein